MQQMKYVTNNTTIWDTEPRIAIRNMVQCCSVERNMGTCCCVERNIGSCVPIWNGTLPIVTVLHGTWNMPISRMRPRPGGQGGSCDHTVIAVTTVIGNRPAPVFHRSMCILTSTSSTQQLLFRSYNHWTINRIWRDEGPEARGFIS